MSRHNNLNKSDVILDESVIEPSPSNTPVKKKLKRIRRKATLKKNPQEPIKSIETDLLEHVIKELEQISTLKETNCKENNSETTGVGINKSLVFREEKRDTSKHSLSKVCTPAASTSTTNILRTRSPSPQGLQQKIIALNASELSSHDPSEVSIPTYRGLIEPIQKTISKNYHNLYVFYLIDEVLAFTPNNFPRNNCVQLVGRFKFCEQKKSHVICSNDKIYGHNYEIKVDMRETSLIPNNGSSIILFGMVCFENNTPIIVAKFFQQSIVDYQTYVDLMLRLRTTVPGENFNMVCVSDNDYRYEETFVEECYDEEFLNGLTESGGHCEGDELSDSMVCAFLDEISFEKL